jgi:glycosyltransferase involved in cell wall biosynthesis
MTVTVCVVVKDRRELMRRCLTAVLAERPDEVVVVDNGSTDGTWEDLLAVTDPRVRIAQDHGSVGRIRNLAAELASSDVVAFTDSDCRPLPGWLAAGQAALTEGVGVVQGRTVPERESSEPWSVTQDIDNPTGLFEACNIFYRRTALLEVGGFDEAVGFFGEDTAAGWAVQRAGWQDAWAPDAVVEHVVTTPGFGWHLRRARGYANWPALIKAFPEKRDLMWHHWFLRRRSAEADATVLGVLAAAALTSPWPLLLALPFGRRHLASAFGPAGLRHARLHLEAAAFDLAVSVALARGSLKHRTAVL